MALNGGKLHRITNDLSSYSNLTLAITRDGKQLLAVQNTSAGGRVLPELGRRRRARRLTQWTIMATSAWSGCRTGVWSRWTTTATSR